MCGMSEFLSSEPELQRQPAEHFFSPELAPENWPPLPEVMAEGSFTPEQVEVVATEEVVWYGDAVEAAIEQEWQRRLANRPAGQTREWNAPSYALRSLAQEEDRLKIELGLTDYKHASCLGTLVRQQNELARGLYSGGIFSSTILTTTHPDSADKWLVYGVRDRGQGRSFKPIGGTYAQDPKVPGGGVIHSADDLWRDAARETAEELGLRPGDLDEEGLKLVMIIRTAGGGFDFTFTGNLELTPFEVQQERFRSRRHREEFDLVYFSGGLPEQLGTALPHWKLKEPLMKGLRQSRKET